MFYLAVFNVCFCHGKLSLIYETVNFKDLVPSLPPENGATAHRHCLRSLVCYSIPPALNFSMEGLWFYNLSEQFVSTSHLPTATTTTWLLTVALNPPIGIRQCCYLAKLWALWLFGQLVQSISILTFSAQLRNIRSSQNLSLVLDISVLRIPTFSVIVCPWHRQQSDWAGAAC
jgi:hypothetical protein